jgi:CheY-like chemotaxis protein
MGITMNMTAISPLNVFLAEDDENDVLLIRRAFRQFPGPTELTVLSDGDAVIAYLSTATAGIKSHVKPDVLVLDRRMGHVSGLDVLFWLRTERDWTSLPVLLLSNVLSPAEAEVITRLRAAHALKSSRFSDLPDLLLQGIRSAMARVQSPAQQMPFHVSPAFALRSTPMVQ